MVCSQTFGMIKPEGVAVADNIEARIVNAGLQIAEKRKVCLTDEQFTFLYGHSQKRIPHKGFSMFENKMFIY